MSRTINNRLDNLESRDGPQDHEYNAVVEWIEDGIEAHYYRDGIEISEARFFREAPKDIKRSVNWGDQDQPAGADHE